MSRSKFNCKIVEKELFLDFNLKNTFLHKTYSLTPESYGLIISTSVFMLFKEKSGYMAISLWSVDAIPSPQFFLLDSAV